MGLRLSSGENKRHRPPDPKKEGVAHTSAFVSYTVQLTREEF